MLLSLVAPKGAGGYMQYASRNPAGLVVVSCFLVLVPWFPSPLVPWSPGSLVPEFLGSLVPWFPVSLVPWFPGSLVPWFPVLCRWTSLAEAMKNKTECRCFFDFVFFVWVPLFNHF